jgi:hypothetical protein
MQQAAPDATRDQKPCQQRLGTRHESRRRAVDVPDRVLMPLRRLEKGEWRGSADLEQARLRKPLVDRNLGDL